jgi:predicted transcriptional regulator
MMLQQLDLLEAVPAYEPPRARRSDPPTSHQAAFKAREFQVSHAGRALDALRRYGPLSTHEIADRTGLTVVQLDRRRNEMIAAGTVRLYKIDGRIVERGGAQVWEAV